MEVSFMEEDIRGAIEDEITKLKSKLIKRLELIKEGSEKGTKHVDFFKSLSRSIQRRQLKIVKEGGRLV